MIKTLVTGPVQVNTYILYGEKDNECFIVDPSDTKKVMDFVEANGLHVTHVLLTHSHFDHILSVADIKEQTGAKVCISALEADGLKNNRKNLSLMSMSRVKPAEADVCLEDGDVIEAAGFTVKCIHTPGHTVGGMCYLIESERILLTGDTLFHTDVGRSDLPGGDARALFESIRDRLFTLEGDYAVYPGHEEPTTLEEERRSNCFMCQGSPDRW